MKIFYNYQIFDNQKFRGPKQTKFVNRWLNEKKEN